MDAARGVMARKSVGGHKLKGLGFASFIRTLGSVPNFVRQKTTDSVPADKTFHVNVGQRVDLGFGLGNGIQTRLTMSARHRMLLL